MLHCNMADRRYSPRTGVSSVTIMSKQLAISSAFSIFAMAAFALFARADDSRMSGGGIGQAFAAAPTEIDVPAGWLQPPGLPALPVLTD